MASTSTSRSAASFRAHADWPRGLLRSGSPSELVQARRAGLKARPPGSTRASSVLACIALLVGTATLVSTTGAPGPRFYPDDPIWVDDDKAFDAKGPKEVEDTGGYDFIVNTFQKPGERRDVRAANVNSLDEVPDSSWFTNRIGRKPVSLPNLVKGPDRLESISLDGWVVSGGKGTGVQPGFRMRDREGHTYQIEIDPPKNPEMASGAEIIGTAFYHAFGYHTVDVYLGEFDLDKMVIADNATLRDPLNRKRRRMTRRDVTDVLKQAARLPNGKYRVLASRFADGTPLGNFRYYGTRPDDPNDIVPHEHRRELRGARVFGAWLNHDDSRGINSLDMLIEENGKRWVKHYMFDFGSIMGSGTIHPQVHRPGNEYILEWPPGFLTLATLGFYLRPWMLIDYPDVPASVGRFEGDAFDPERWKHEYPNPAFQNMRPDDAFWAARIVSRFSDEMVRAIVEKAKYSDPRATEYVTATLIKRRDKVLRLWLNQVNPVVDVALDASGTLTFENAAVAAKAAAPAESYTLQWFTLENARNERTNVGDPMTVSELRARVPASGLSDSPYIGVAITAKHPQQIGWARPATFYFRRTQGGWETIGAER
jgi:hypothetical protein